MNNKLTPILERELSKEISEEDSCELELGLTRQQSQNTASDIRDIKLLERELKIRREKIAFIKHLQFMISQEKTKFIVTVKLPRDAKHDPRHKITGKCPVSKGICTDTTGEHHSVFVEADHMADVADSFRNFHVTRIEEVR